jgi:hypothetical protein
MKLKWRANPMLNKQALLEWLREMMIESVFPNDNLNTIRRSAYTSIIQEIQSGRFDAVQSEVQRLRAALEAIVSEPIKLGFFMEWIDKAKKISFEALSTTEQTCCQNPDVQTFGPNEVIKNPTNVCVNCGKLLDIEPSDDRLRAASKEILALIKEIRNYEAYSWNNDRQFIESRLNKIEALITTTTKRSAHK